MSKIKYWVVFVVMFSVVILGGMMVSCGTVGLDSHMTNLNLGKITENEIKERVDSSKFIVSTIRKGAKNLHASSATGVTNIGTIPIVFTFNNGVISSYNIVIYPINVDGTKGSAITITSSKISDLGDSSELYIYTETLTPVSNTFEIVIVASGTKNSFGQYMDSDDDGVPGETEDNCHYRFSTGGGITNTLKPYPRAIVTTPTASELDPFNTIYGFAHVQTNFNKLRNSTNGPGNQGMNVDSFSSALKVVSDTDGKTYPMTITVLAGTNLTSTMDSSLPIGAYTIYLYENQVKESVAVNEYIHRKDNHDKTVYVGTANFAITTTNALPTRGGPVLITSSSKILELSFSVDMDWSTFTSATVFITNNVGETLNTTLTPVSSDTIRISSPSSGSFGGDGSVTNRIWSIVLFNYKLKSVNGDIISSQGETWTWTD